MKKYQIIPVVATMLMLWMAACSGGQQIQSYEPGCEKIVVNVKAGVVNGIAVDASTQKIARQFPCAQTGTSDNCGTYMGSEAHNFYFYHDRSLIEVNFPFRGTVTPQVMTTSRERLQERIGQPVRTEKNGKMEYLFYEMDYGTLIVIMQGGKSRDFIMHSQDPEEVQLCR